jgi:hypothetical protein
LVWEATGCSDDAPGVGDAKASSRIKSAVNIISPR